MSASEHTPFGVLLRHYPLAAGLAQSALAERAGLSERAINDLEREPRRTPRLETVTRLAAALGLSDAERGRLLEGARPATLADPSPSSSLAEPSAPAPLAPLAPVRIGLALAPVDVAAFERDLASVRAALDPAAFSAAWTAGAAHSTEDATAEALAEALRLA